MSRTKKKPSVINFFAEVYEVVRLVPKGCVTTYGAIAYYLGSKSGARMVGWALHGCPKGIPAHRVVNRAGLLTGKVHFKPPSAMQAQLKKEGIIVVKNKVKNFSEVFLGPSQRVVVTESRASRSELPASDTAAGIQKQPNIEYLSKDKIQPWVSASNLARCRFSK